MIDKKANNTVFVVVRQMLNKILPAWALVVISAYLYFHNYVILFFVAVIILGLLAGLYVLLRFIDIQLPRLNNVSPLGVVVCFTVLVTSYVVFVYGYYATEILPVQQVVSALLNSYLSIVLRVGFIFVLAMYSLGVGRLVYGYLHKDNEGGVLAMAFHFALGIMALSYIAYALAWLQMLSVDWLLFVLIVLGLIARKHIVFYLQKFWVTRISWQQLYLQKEWFPFNVTYIYIFIALVVLFIASLHLYPIESDDLAVYHNLPQLFASLQGMVPFYDSPAATAGGIMMAFQAGVVSLVGSAYVFTLSWMFFVALLVGLYALAFTFFSKRVAIVTLLFSVVAPWHIFFVQTQKVVFVLAFFSIVAMASLLMWLRERKSSHLYITAMFAGFAVAVKLSAFVFIAGLVVLFIYLFFTKQLGIKQAVVFTVVGIVCSIPVLAYNTYYYHNPVIPVHLIQKARMDRLFDSGERIRTIDLYATSKLIPEENKVITRVTRKNQTYENPLKNFFWRIWNTTVHQEGVNILYVQFGPWLLILLPGWLLFFWLYKLHHNKNFVYIYTIVISGLLLWSIRGFDRPWYGISIFYAIALLGALYYDSVKTRFVRVGINWLLAIWAVLFLFIGVVWFDADRAAVLAGEQTIKQAEEHSYWYQVATLANQEIQKNPEARMLLLPGQYASYIKDNHKHVVASGYGYYWSQVVQESASLDDIYSILQQQGITHIIHLKHFEDWLWSFVEGEEVAELKLFRAYTIFEEFKTVYLKQVGCVHTTCIYKLQ